MDGNLKYHVPVLLERCIENLNIRPDGIYVDVTFGGGGHSGAILDRLGTKGRLFGFDQDADAEANVSSDVRFTFVRSNFRYLSNFMDWHDIQAIDGLLADLGVSSHHFDDATRGFSFRFDGALDMRMNQQAAVKASDVVNDYPEEALATVFHLYGELKNARQLSKAIVAQREQKKIITIRDFVAVIQPFFPKRLEQKGFAQVFQALRIEVNRELEALKEMLLQALALLKTGGRLVVITYHSLEDRLVKNFFKSGNFEGTVTEDFYGNRHTPFRLINNKVIVPDEEEIRRNPRARSAKLRVAEKIA
ncbi:MAG: 16S rRNA (cytosine(1402)-N(4))-methyltransferase RsmH [Dysgonamonadaceae bacterium]|jgi:16S rRNA (cytosine1402-N4)-methyltransferase|nr:16S rRNA (cytosine(1402)-N(4))-methyltransferase RsmH [Dysgonamonadaceae bacterium]